MRRLQSLQCGWFQVLRFIAVATVFAAGGLVGCSNGDSQTGPGPVGPVGPQGQVGPVGDETGIPGSGTIATETRDVTNFDQIVFRSEGTVLVTRADTGSLTIEADDNLQRYLEASVGGGVLEIVTADGAVIAPSKPPVFRIATSDVGAVGLAGAGTIDIGLIETDRLEITLSGVGDITIGAVDVDELMLDLTGVGTVSLTGATDRQDALVAGVSFYDGSDLASRFATIEAAAMGEATIWVSAELEVTARDSASVGYYGTPAVIEDVSGSATVNPLGTK